MKRISACVFLAVFLCETCFGLGNENFAVERDRMVRDQIERRGITDKRVLDAMRKVERHLFVPPDLRSSAYRDTPLPIGYGQTISQPYIVAYMTQAAAIKPNERVLEIGTGSGYQAAVLAEIADEVYTVEILKPLVDRASSCLEDLGYANVHVRLGDGYKGWKEYAPFDAIIVTAAPRTIPEELLGQLAIGGRMVVPVGAFFQELYLITRTEKGFDKEAILPVRFVPMVHPEEQHGLL